MRRQPTILRAACYAAAKDRAGFDWIGDGSRSIPPALGGFVDFQAEQASAMATADRFIENTIKDFASRYRAFA